MKTFKLNTQILIICCSLIASAVSVLKVHVLSDGREYLIEYEHKYNWFQALHECASWDRQLLIMDSPEKQDVISELFKGEIRINFLWLGANDEFNPSGDADRTFFWSATGKQFTYANWEENYPEKIHDNRHCVLIFLGHMKWRNDNCTTQHGFICEEKQLLESSNKNSNNASDGVQKFIDDFDLKFQSLLKDNMAQLNGQLENIKQVGKNTSYEVEKLTNITQTSVQKILNKQEISTKELNHDIAKQGSDLSGQLKRTVDELNAKYSEKQNFIYPPNNILLIK